MHANSILIFEKYAKKYFQPSMKVLEIGPNKFPSTYQSIINDKSITWDTLDIYNSSDLTYCTVDEYQYPIPDNYYDIVLSGNVLEHVRKIWVWIKELARVCKNGGTVISIAPLFLEYHAHPVDCWRVFPEGMKALYEEGNLEMILSVYETLDTYNPRFTLSTLQSCGAKFKYITRLFLRKIGFPIERIYTYDTISIGKKVITS
jgi:hypothetical protein